MFLAHIPGDCAYECRTVTVPPEVIGRVTAGVHPVKEDSPTNQVIFAQALEWKFPAPFVLKESKEGVVIVGTDVVHARV